MDDHVIEIMNTDDFVEHRWHMRIDLLDLANSAGKREKDGYNGGTYTIYPMAKAKKLLKLIRRHGSEEDLAKCDRYFAGNKRLNKFWKEIR